MGRNGQRYQVMGIGLRPDHWDELKRLAEEREQSVSSLIRQAVTSYLTQVGRLKEAEDELAS